MANQKKFLLLAIMVGIAGVGIGAITIISMISELYSPWKYYNKSKWKIRFSQYIMGLTTFFIYPWDIENVVNQEEEV